MHATSCLVTLFFLFKMKCKIGGRIDLCFHLTRDMTTVLTRVPVYEESQSAAAADYFLIK